MGLLSNLIPPLPPSAGAVFAINYNEMQMKTLNAKQRAAARLLASGESGIETAKALKIDPATLSRWRGIPDFEHLSETYLASFEQEGIKRLQALKGRAVERLADLLNHPNANVALKAAEAILSRSPAPNPAPNSLTKHTPEQIAEAEEINIELALRLKKFAQSRAASH